MPASAFSVRVLLGSLLLLLGCTDAYLPDAITSPPSLLVVDGCINSKGPTTIKLSRTYAIASDAPTPTEARATVAIEEENGARYLLSESAGGTYTSAALRLDPAKQYRLRINTQGGQEYASAFVPVKNTPPIDSVNWRAGATGVNIYVNAHDDTKSTQYYRWDCEETWEIVPNLIPQLEWYNNGLRPIREPFPHICWGNERAADIKLTKTTALSQDVVANFQLRNYPTTSGRLRHRYSLLVKQYAQTREEYQYWELLRKNTESIGTLFDPLPSQVTGNVRCLSDETLLALGYVGAYSVEQRRIFITRNQLPFDWKLASSFDRCVPDTVEYKYYRAVFNYPGNQPLYEPVPNSRALSTSRECVDCRLQGSTVRPSFW